MMKLINCDNLFWQKKCTTDADSDDLNIKFFDSFTSVLINIDLFLHGTTKE